MSNAVDNWDAAISEFWDGYDSLAPSERIPRMQALVEECPSNDGRGAFEVAGVYDSMDMEAEACSEYERALELGLDDARHAQLVVQYGSTLRNLGLYDEAIQILSNAPTHESTGDAPRIMLALALHSAGRKDEACESPSKLTLTHSPSINAHSAITQRR